MYCSWLGQFETSCYRGFGCTDSSMYSIFIAFILHTINFLLGKFLLVYVIHSEEEA